MKNYNDYNETINYNHTTDEVVCYLSNEEKWQKIIS